MNKQIASQKNSNPAKNKKHSIIYFSLVICLLSLLLFGGFSPFIHNEELALSPEELVSNNDSAQPLSKDVTQREHFNQPVEPTTDLTKKIHQSLVQSHFIGSALIIANGQIVLQKGYGYRDFAKKIPNTYNSLFQIGSVQKAMTATLIMEQVALGKLKLEDPLNKFYPSIPESQKITIRQLLMMTSGLHPTDSPKQLMTPDELIQFAVKHIKLENYNVFQYKPINYTLLAGVLAQLTEIDYYHLFQQKIIANLHLAETFFYQDFLSQSNTTHAYKNINGIDYSKLIHQAPIDSLKELGTGNVATSNADLYWFFYSFIQGRIITPDLIQSLWTPKGKGDYMGGLYNYNHYYFGHGVKAGFETVLYLSKDGKNAVILNSNECPGNKLYKTMGKVIFNQLS